MALFHESNLDWVFDEDWLVLQYDNSTWYRKHFNACAESAAVDFIVVHPSDPVGWLVEAKDFTTSAPDHAKGPLHRIVTKKVRDALAGVFAGAKNAHTEDERRIFGRLLEVELRVVFHCQRPKHKSKLFRSLPDAADLRQKLRQTLRAVDTKVLVLDSASSAGVPWETTWHP